MLYKNLSLESGSVPAVAFDSREYNMPGPRAVHGLETARSRETSEDDAIRDLAGRICDVSAQATRLKSTGNAEIFDPLQGYRDLKYHLIGDVRPVARLNMHYPPGTERCGRRGLRVYGVECGVMIDPTNGEVLVWRKDNMVSSKDPTDWFVATYNLVTGEFHEREVVMVDVSANVSGMGDDITLQIAPVLDPRNANRGYTILRGYVSSYYHTLGDITASRIDYHGRGVGPTAHEISEGIYSVDIYTLHTALAHALRERGLSPELLDHAPDPMLVLAELAMLS